MNREAIHLVGMTVFVVYFALDVVAMAMLSARANANGQIYGMAIPLTNLPFWVWQGFPVCVEGVWMLLMVAGMIGIGLMYVFRTNHRSSAEEM